MMESKNRMLMTVLVLSGGSLAWGQDAPVVSPPATTPETDPPAVVQEDSETPKQEAAPSLDDLLDLEESGDGDADAPIAESDRRALDAALAEEKPTEAFRAAIADMLVSTDLLEDRSDAGLGTQRIQQRIVDRLQALIDSASRQQQPQPQPGAGQQQQQQDPGRRNEQEPQDGNQQANQNQGESRNDQGDQDGSSVQPPPPEGGELAGPLDGAGIEWGGLPPRMRELITQGTRDRVSEMYRSLTEAYYRRMAEEGGR